MTELDQGEFEQSPGSTSRGSGELARKVQGSTAGSSKMASLDGKGNDVLTEEIISTGPPSSAKGTG